MAETNATNAPVALQVPTSVKTLIEALIFGAREPLSVRQIQAMYEDQGTSGGEPRKIDYEEINRSVEELNAEYSASDRPYRIVQIAGGFQFATLPLYAEWLGKLYKEQARRKLSQSSIETLAIIAYKQPITKPEIESIRGVNCDYVLSTLLEKDLATIVGRAPTVGRPLLYGTSKEFLRHFGLNDLIDLPRPREIQEILGDSQFETERRMLEAQQGVEEKKEEDFKSRLPHIPKRKAGLDNEVKILPKKRVRDIKVLPADATGTDKTDAAASEQPVEEAVGTAVVPIADQKEPEITDGQPSILQEIPIIENDEAEASIDQPAVLPDVPNEVETSGSMKYFEISPSPEPESRREETDIEEMAPTAHEQWQPSEVADMTAEEPTPERVVEEPSQSLPEPPSTSSIQVDEVSTKINQEPELQVSEEPIVQEVLEVIPQVVEEIVIQQVPQAVAPTTEEHDELALAGERQMLADEPHADSDTPHPKTRWKSWKEKIQGFIKKLFG
ncbi:MAG: SMC-Scp complex subunit ScpB [Ignavibacteriales bacterium]|nr:SMC-Scp complex subunit ScpB [Ignavibacteriales bacterium]